MEASNKVEGIKEIVEAAQSAVSGVSDKDLRVAAFSRVLEHLLTGEPTKARKTRAKRRVSGARKKDPGAKKKKPSVDGPRARLEELIEEGFFSEPRNSSAIIEALSERGYHMQPSDLTRPLPALAQEQKLRRKKMAPPDGGKKVWHYSNW